MRNRLTVGGVLVLALVLLSCAPGARALGPAEPQQEPPPAVTAPELPRQAPAAVAVMTFQNNTGRADMEWLGAGTAETLTTEFAASGKFRVVEKEQIDKVVGELKFELSGLVDPDTAQELGKILGAEHVILGSYQLFRGVLKLNARRIETATGKVFEAAAVTGQEADVFDLQEQLAHVLMEQIRS